MIRHICRFAVLSAVMVLVQAMPPMDIGSVWGASSIKIGVVDPQVVLERSKAGKRALADLKQYAAARQKILTAYEDELKPLDDELKLLDGELKDQKSMLTDEGRRSKQEQFRGKVQAFQDKRQAYQREVQKFRQELALKEKEFIEEYMKKISAATKIVAEKQGLALVVDKGSDKSVKIVIYNKQSLDVTNQVVREFDRRFK